MKINSTRNAHISRGCQFQATALRTPQKRKKREVIFIHFAYIILIFGIKRYKFYEASISLDHLNQAESGRYEILVKVRARSFEMIRKMKLLCVGITRYPRAVFIHGDKRFSRDVTMPRKVREFGWFASAGSVLFAFLEYLWNTVFTLNERIRVLHAMMRIS